MAFDAQKEDYQRLGLRFARSLSQHDPLGAVREFASFGRRYAQNRDSLPQTDADRAFHLVADAANLIDYQLPFATDEEAETIVARGHRLLDEALALDPSCHDAIRMKMSAQCPSFEAYYDFLREGAADVRASCLEAQEEAGKDESPERAAIGVRIAMRPYLRWLATYASKAVICGRNHEALRVVAELLEIDPLDEADARFTGALAYAKLEDEAGLAQLMQHKGGRSLRGSDDAWTRLSLASLAYRRRAFDEARDHVAAIVKTYPYAVPTLALQRDIPDGVFARLAAAPHSEDELVLAVSEGTVLLQEGRDAFGRGSFGSWLMLEALGLATREELAELSDLVESVASALPEGWHAPQAGGIGQQDGVKSTDGARPAGDFGPTSSAKAAEVHGPAGGMRHTGDAGTQDGLGPTNSAGCANGLGLTDSDGPTDGAGHAEGLGSIDNGEPQGGLGPTDGAGSAGGDER